MVRQLVPLHEAAGEAYRLPKEGIVTIGRRLENHIICRDISVSGKHCLLKIAQGLLEVVDCSSNGTFVNDRKLVKGQRQTIGDGDILSLMKPVVPTGEALTPTPPSRVQFRLDLRPGDSPPDVHLEDRNAQGLSLDVALSLPPTPTAAALQRGATTDGFAHSLLVQEQQSKAKITGELLLARRRLDEERARVELLSKELRRARASLEDERLRRAAAQEAREQQLPEATQLRAERRQLQELRASHDALIEQHDRMEVELTAQVQRAASLEAAQERNRGELERTKAGGAQTAQQLEELQGRLQRAQASTERFERQQAEARLAAEAAQREAERLQREFCAERAAREQLEDQRQLLRSEAERAEQGERAARDLLEAAAVQRGELEGRAARSRGDAEAARASAQEAQGRHEAELGRIEGIRAAAGRLTDGLRVFIERWSHGISEEGCSDEPGFGAARPAAASHEAAADGAACADAGPVTASPAAVQAEDSEAGGTQRAPGSDESDEEDTAATAAADEAVHGPEADADNPAQAQPWSVDLLSRAAAGSPADTATGAGAGGTAPPLTSPASPTCAATAAELHAGSKGGSPSPPKRRRLHRSGR